MSDGGKAPPQAQAHANPPGWPAYPHHDAYGLQHAAAAAAVARGAFPHYGQPSFNPYAGGSAAAAAAAHVGQHSAVSLFGGAHHEKAAGQAYGFPGADNHHGGFSSLGSYHAPLPAHNPLPSHLRTAPQNPPSAAPPTVPPGSSPLPAHLRSSPYATPQSSQGIGYHHSPAYPGYPLHGGQHGDSQSPAAPPSRRSSETAGAYGKYSSSVANGHETAKQLPHQQQQQPSHTNHSAYAGQPQQYGNPKEFTSLFSKSSFAGLSHYPGGAASAYGGSVGGQESYAASSASSVASLVGAGGNGYDPMAATILNSFGGSQLQSSLVHSELTRQNRSAAGGSADKGLNLSNPPSPKRDANGPTGTASNLPTTPTVPTHHHPSSTSTFRDVAKLVHQPRGPTIDARGNANGESHLPHSVAAPAAVARPTVHPLPPSTQAPLVAATSQLASALAGHRPKYVANEAYPIPVSLTAKGSEAANLSTHPLLAQSTASGVSNEASAAPSSNVPVSNAAEEAAKEAALASGRKRKADGTLKMKWKRFKDSNASSTTGGGSQSAVLAGESDPYSFEEDENNSTVELTRFGAGGSKEPPAAPSGGSAGPVYKFKSALLSRESRGGSTDSRASTGSATKAQPLVLDKAESVFLESCERLLCDLSTQPVSVSLRPNMDAYRERLAARMEKNANRGRKRKSDLVAAAAATVDDEEEDEGDADDGEDLDTSDDAPLKPPKKETSSSKESTPKKSPGRKKKARADAEASSAVSADGTDEIKEEDVQHMENGHSKAKSDDGKHVKKGGLWALPIVPKLPQKTDKKAKAAAVVAPCPAAGAPTSSSASQAAAGGSLSDVWRQAFGGVKTSKRPPGEPPLLPAVSSKVKSEPQTKVRTYFDVPPEIRRRPRPNFGGLIHFSPDWEQRVRNHHTKCRLPPKLARGMVVVKPRILRSENGANAAGSSSSSVPAKSSVPVGCHARRFSL
jgi:hypothetical protein